MGITNSLNSDISDRMIQEYSSTILDSSRIVEGLVVDNSTISKDGYIKVMLIDYETTPMDSKFPNNSKLELHNDAQKLSDGYDRFNARYNNYDDSWNRLGHSIVDCYIATPFSGSYQNSGWFICPPINSKGLVVNVNGVYVWLCGIFKPVPYNWDETQQGGSKQLDTFLPFPSNIPQAQGIDFEVRPNKDGILSNKGSTYDIKKDKFSLKIEDEKTDVSNFSIFDSNKKPNSNVILLRTVYPGGDKIKNHEKLRDGKGKIKDVKEIESLQKEYNQKNYPTETIFEISGERWWVHKATEWSFGTLSDVNETVEKKQEDLKELKWYDSYIGRLDGLDRFTSEGTLLNGKEGVGSNVVDISTDDLKYNRTYSTADETVSEMSKINGQDTKSISVSMSNNNGIVEFKLLNNEQTITFNLNVTNGVASLKNTNANGDSTKVSLTGYDINIINESSRDINIIAQNGDIIISCAESITLGNKDDSTTAKKSFVLADESSKVENIASGMTLSKYVSGQ